MILEHHAVPVSLGSVEDGTLCHTVSASVEGSLQDDFLFVLASQGLAAEATFRARLPAGPVNNDDVVIIADMVHVCTLGTKAKSLTWFGDDDLVDAALLDSLEVGSELGEVQLAISIDHVHATIVVEQKACVVEEGTLNLVTLPVALGYVVGTVNVGLVLVVSNEECIVGSIVVT